MVVKMGRHVTSQIAFKSLAVGWGGWVGGWSESDYNATLSSAKSLSVRTSVAITTGCPATLPGHLGEKFYILCKLTVPPLFAITVPPLSAIVK